MDNTKQDDRVNILQRECNNGTFKRVLKYALDPHIQFYIKKIDKVSSENNTSEITLDEALDVIDEKILSYEITGNKAYELVDSLLIKLNPNDSEVLHRVMQKNLLCGLGYKTVNMVYKNFIPETPYMRCSTLDDKTLQNVKFPAMLQVKEDGQFVNFIITKNGYQLLSRNGKDIFISSFANIAKEIYSYVQDEIVLLGELLVINNTNGEILDRQTGNGYIQRGNHDNPNYTITIKTWDMIPYQNWLKGKYEVEYHKRFRDILILSQQCPIKCVKSEIVHDIEYANIVVKKWMDEGLEGGILKDTNGIWKDGTSKQQLKIKGVFDADLIIVDMLPGKEHSNCENILGALLLESADGKVSCKVGTGFTYEQRKEMYENKGKYVGKIATIAANKLTKDNSLYLPRLHCKR